MAAVAFISVYLAWVCIDTAPTWAISRSASFASEARFTPSTAMTPTTSSSKIIGATTSGWQPWAVSSRSLLRVGGGWFSKSRRSMTCCTSTA
jgi:hypothetical protein